MIRPFQLLLFFQITNAVPSIRASIGAIEYLFDVTGPKGDELVLDPRVSLRIQELRAQAANNDIVSLQVKHPWSDPVSYIPNVLFIIDGGVRVS